MNSGAVRSPYSADVPRPYRDAVTRCGEAAFAEVRAFEARERAAGTVFPPAARVFAALDFAPPEKVRAVILGQDPYHDDGQAQGLSFSVPRGIRTPPSLRNIFKELASDTRTPVRSNPDLSDWAEQGVLLLNTVLTVRAHQAASHRNCGWEKLTAGLLSLVNERAPHAVFVLWGAPAQKMRSLVDESRHLVLESAHPSPLSAYRGFFGSRPFTRCNEFLTSHGIAPIDWAGGGAQEERLLI